MRDISQELAIYVGRDGKPTRGATKEEVAALYSRLWEEFGSSEVGEKLHAAGGPNAFNRVFEVFEQRCATVLPCDTPYFEILEEIGRDILTSLPKPTPVAPTTAAPTLSLVDQVRRDMTDPEIPTSVVRQKRRESVEYERAFQQANQPTEVPSTRPPVDSDIARFAHMVNADIKRRGVGVLRANAGTVTIEADGTGYVYPLAEFQKKFEAATTAGLIR